MCRMLTLRFFKMQITTKDMAAAAITAVIIKTNNNYKRLRSHTEWNNFISTNDADENCAIGICGKLLFPIILLKLTIRYVVSNCAKCTKMWVPISLHFFFQNEIAQSLNAPEQGNKTV